MDIRIWFYIIIFTVQGIIDGSLWIPILQGTWFLGSLILAPFALIGTIILQIMVLTIIMDKWIKRG